MGVVDLLLWWCHNHKEKEGGERRMRICREKEGDVH